MHKFHMPQVKTHLRVSIYSNECIKHKPQFVMYLKTTHIQLWNVSEQVKTKQPKDCMSFAGQSVKSLTIKSRSSFQSVKSSFQSVKSSIQSLTSNLKSGKKKSDWNITLMSFLQIKVIKEVSTYSESWFF